MRQAINWLMEPTTVQQLEDAFFQYAAEPFAAELSQAVDNLIWARTAMAGERSR
jgi:hypothetical protein